MDFCVDFSVFDCGFLPRLMCDMTSNHQPAGRLLVLPAGWSIITTRS